jgi:hypothetical protein
MGRFGPPLVHSFMWLYSVDDRMINECGVIGVNLMALPGPFN